MANRFQFAQHKLAYEFIAERDGEFCLICFIEKHIKRGPPAIKLQIDHADGNPKNWSPDNLHLLCQAHNLEMRKKTSIEHKRLISEYSAVIVCVRARENLHTPTQTAKAIVDYTSASPEMQANSIFEQPWLDFMHGWLGANGSIPKKEAIYGGAAAIGCSPATTERYLGKYTSSMGCFKESKDNTGARIIVYNDSLER
ncbi:hypothetical protein ACFLWU_06510, partial [Chloroflexota bacterium]